MMRRNLLVGVLSLLATVAWTQTNVRNRVEVVYFYGKQRCQTCMAIEKYAHEVVDQDFAVEKKKGKGVFKVVDMSTTEGAKIAKAYRVTWSSLYINGWKEGKEDRNDMTKFAFRNARYHTDEFKKGLRVKMKELLR